MNVVNSHIMYLTLKQLTKHFISFRIVIFCYKVVWRLKILLSFINPILEFSNTCMIGLFSHWVLRRSFLDLSGVRKAQNILLPQKRHDRQKAEKRLLFLVRFLPHVTVREIEFTLFSFVNFSIRKKNTSKTTT